MRLKPEKDTSRNESYRSIPLTNTDAKILNQILANQFNSTLEESYIMIKWDLSLGSKDGSIYANQ